MVISRRAFMQGAVALGAAEGFAAPAVGGPVEKGALKMKLGVLSDVHMTPKGSCAHWERALRELDQWGADGVLVCGDLADFGTIPELERVAKIWFEVFPDNRGSNGRRVANLMHYGDHDTSGGMYRNSRECVQAYPDEEQMKKVVIPLNDRKAIWERCFHEEWAPIVKKTVKGYDFVLSHFTKGEPGNYHGNNVPGLDEFMSRLKIDPDKPFFYSQHRVLKDTAGGPYAYGQDDGTARGLFSSKYPNCVAFCGHHHLTCAEELAIWQGEFTCVAVPSLSYNITLAGRENGYSLVDTYKSDPKYMMTGITNGSQGYFVLVYENAIDIRRWNFSSHAAAGPDWSVPLPVPGDKYSHARRARSEPAPEFPADVKIKVALAKDRSRDGEVRDFVVTSFPSSPATASTPRANDYEVQLLLRRG
ncbi:MAG: metallophosphoesterase family protein, partial [Kiritimatiellae bacterium]|nr:metallophosphoesterase family protein [Kiritimatiellia bacterium]